MDKGITIRGCDIKVVQADITDLAVDAIVNAANNKLVMGGGVAGAIRKKGGSVIVEEAVKKGPIKIGEAIATCAGNLPSRYVIHAATMGMDFKTDEIKIRASCKSALDLAKQLKIRSIAFPALGCGVGEFPLLASAKIMAQEAYRHLRDKNATLKEIIFSLYNKEAFEIFTQGVIGYLTHVTRELGSGPFVTVDAIIEISETQIVIIKRSNPPLGWALPGGFVDYGESLEEAVAREAKEETGLELTAVTQFHTYSDPARDPRFHTIGTVFIAKAKGNPRAGDDAAGLKIIEVSGIDSLEFAFDHKRILQDYLQFKKGRNPF